MPVNPEGVLGKFLNEVITDDLLKKMADGFTAEALSDMPPETWCHINSDTQIKKWLVIRISDCDDAADKKIAKYKKKLAPLLKSMPEGQGAVFLPSNLAIQLELVPTQE